jgi:type IV pilus assembly protein PilZ
MGDDEKPGAEARNHPRVPIDLKVDYRRMNAFFADYTRNISKGGMFIKTATPLEVGARFVVRLRLPAHPEGLELMADVVWSSAVGESPGMGLKFVYASDEQRREFERFVEELMAASLGPELAGRLLKKDEKP